ncbi:ComF family protein [Halanaerobium praevalens]|uniref:Phosphoribosyltransferase n=1 Tax=Halanaerobium praevalens (strain ATCC 33744 / DSM 2228 / GSL) TaxID=572479 RepID=E3DR53_HALPG|nr:ComF family protein [Halanaerobium praevalens]ADO78042.1 phosphoribosyltransferase [Halanaerobium praevalens DSM 2228]
MKVLDILKDLVYPEKPVCLACGRRYDHSEIKAICDRCLAKFSFITEACPLCGREVIPAALIEGHPCPECEKEKPPYNFARSVFSYAGYAREVLLEYKYGHRPDLAKPFSRLLRLYYAEYFQKEAIDYLIPVPMHGDRRTYRGYNQAALLAENLAGKINKEYKDVLLRVKNSLPLYALTKKARKLELEGAFALKDGVDPSIFKDKNLLIIDDIMTTGTTSAEISHFVLKEMGAANVYVLTTASVPVKIN